MILTFCTQIVVEEIVKNQTSAFEEILLKVYDHENLGGADGWNFLSESKYRCVEQKIERMIRLLQFWDFSLMMEADLQLYVILCFTTFSRIVQK